MSERHEITNGNVAAAIAAHGAELVSLKDGAGEELLWQAGAEWPRHAPTLFPIVGRLDGDRLHHEGVSYPIGQHGFARDMDFSLVEKNETRVVLQLTDSEASRLHYPFAFALSMIYALDGATLSVTTRVENTGEVLLGCGVGAHPGFRWPLVEGIAKTAHRIDFSQRETGHALGVEGGLLAEERPLPFDGERLMLDEALFARDAIVMPNVRSDSVTYSALGGDGEPVRSLRVAWDGYKDLGIWSKPGGAPFVCIEPWFSMASPVGWEGEFLDKPGILRLQPGETRNFTWHVTL